MTTTDVTQETPVEQVKTDAQPAPAPEVVEDPNWRAVREQRKKDKAAREEAEKRAAEAQAQAEALKAAMEAAFAKSPPPMFQQPQSEYHEETEDDRIEKKVQAAIAAREAAAEKARIEREKAELPARLRQAFPDYDKVINDENGAYLEYHHPELLRTILRQPENFETCADTYKLVKKLIPGLETAKKEEIKSQANLLKPKSISSPTVTQSGEATHPLRLSEEKKAANWARMQAQLRSLE